MSEKKPFIINRIKSVGYAFKGMLILIKTEASIKTQLCIALVVIGAGFYFDISQTEWIAQIAMIGLVLSLEGMNTSVEALADFIHPDFHEKIGTIKDVAAGAVFIASIAAVAIACVIYIPKFT